MKNFTLILCMLAISAFSFAQQCPVINSTAVNTNGSPNDLTLTVNYSADPGTNHINMVVFCPTNPLGSLFTVSCIPVNSSGISTVNFSCGSDPVVILVPASGACGEGFPCGLPTFVLGPVGGPLPIKIASFNANRAAGNVNLSWTTEVEINAREFQIERKTTSGFETVGVIEATNKTTGSRYSFTDNNNSKGVSQYRIKMVDQDGTFRLTEIRAVKGTESRSDFSVFPNPSTGDAKVVISDVSDATDVQLIDNSGRVLKTYNSSNKNTIDIQGLQKGMYMIRVINKETGETVTKKLTVIN